MKTSPFWPRTTATKPAALSSNEACGVDRDSARLASTFASTLALVALLLCLLVVLTGCEGEESSKPRTTAPLGQKANTSDPNTSDRKSLNQVSDGSHQYVGSATCGQCHEQAYAQWQVSHHAMAMAEPTDDSVKGDFGAAPLRLAGQDISFAESGVNFTIRLDGAGGELESFRVVYTFGISPLQQYLVNVGGGRLQALPVVWDARDDGRGWYHLQPETLGNSDDVLHWTASGQNWNHMCADCHSTAVTKGFDATTDTFRTQFAEVSVGCEACHGPGAAHSETPAEFPVVSLRDPDIRLAVCGSCHSRRSQIAEGFVPGKPLLDHYEPSLLDEGLYFADGQILDEVFVYGSFLQSKMHNAGVSCGDCHEPHSGQLQRSGNAVCTDCHSPAGSGRFPGLRPVVYDSPDHHFHAVVDPPVGKLAAGSGSGSACVDCHMAARTYMGVDDRRDHSFRVPRPDLSAELGVPNACIGCHQQQSHEWAAEQIKARGGGAPAPHFARVLAPARQGKRQAQDALGALAGDQRQPAILRATALGLLGQYDPSARELHLAVADADPLVRLGALRGLGAAGPANWRIVMPLLDDPLRALRFAAVTALLPNYPQLPVASRARLTPAVDEFLEHLSMNADRAEALTSRALVHLAKGETDRAEGDLLSALQRNPAWVPGMVNLADLYRATGRDPQAGPLLDQALALSPQSSQVRVAAALWRVRQGHLDQAIELLAQGHAARLESASGYVYAVALSSAGQPAKALSVIDDLLEADLYSAQLLQLGISLAQQSRGSVRLNRYQDALRRLSLSRSAASVLNEIP